MHVNILKNIYTKKQQAETTTFRLSRVFRDYHVDSVNCEIVRVMRRYAVCNKI